MINYVEVFLNSPATTKLDLSQEFDIALQYSIADIRDISKRNAAFSKTILLPGTKNNNYWLGNLYDINSDFTFFNPNVKTPCSISVNSEIVMQGFLQLRKIKKLVNVDHQGNLIYYEVVIFNNAVDLMSELGEKTLNQLDLGELTHTYSKSNIIYSWTQSWTWGWVYPMYGLPGGNPNIYNVTDFYPAYYSKYLLNQIFQEAGFGWTGSLLTNPQFEREIIPWVGSGSQSISQAVIDADNFRVGITQSATYSQASFTLSPTGTYSLVIPPYTNTGVILSNVATTQFFGTSDLTPFQPTFTYSLPEDNFQNPLNPGDSFYDNSGDWDTTLSLWTTSQNRTWAPIWQANWDLTFKNENSDAATIKERVPQPGGGANDFLTDIFELSVEHIVEYQLPSSSTWLLWNKNIINKVGWKRASTSSMAAGETVTENIKSYLECDERFLPIGSKVRLRVLVHPQGNVICYLSYFGNTNDNSKIRKIQMSIQYKSDKNFLFSNGLALAAQEGDPIEPRQWLNPKIKQKDFITDLIKRYNLFIGVSPTNDRLLILDTRQDFYDKVLDLDWTKKKDYSSEDEITLLSELQFKEMLFTMKPDTSDPINRDYTASTGDIYGQYKYIFGNEFVKGEQKIESPFSPTPLVKTGFGAVVPALSPQDPKVNPRVLYWGGLINSNQIGFTWEFRSNSSGNNFWTQYPYAGHFDNPHNPTLDIHFGTPAYMYYYDYGNLPKSTMYETYWASYINQIEDGKLVKSSFYLDEFDIRTIKDNFWARIFILDSYYYVNKIIDYKPLQGGVTNVELIKIKEGFAYKPEPGATFSRVRPPKKIQEPLPIGNIGKNNGSIGLDGSLVIGNGNVGGGKWVVGSYSYSPKQLILGDNNTVGSDNSGVLGGSNNIVLGRGSWLIQSDDTISTLDNQIGISTRGVTLSDSSSIYMGGGLQGDLVSKLSDYGQFNRGINFKIEGYDVGQADWRIIPEEKEVLLQAGKQTYEKEITILGHLDIQDIVGTYSFGQGSQFKRGLVQVEETVNVEGLLTVGGELWIGTPPPQSDRGIGVFYSTINQNPLFINTPRKISLNTTNISEGIWITSDSRIVIQKPDYYRMTVTILLENLSNSFEDVIFWLKFNGVDYPNSGHFVSINERKSAGVPSDSLISYEFIGRSINPLDYVELYWRTTSTNVELKTKNISGVPFSPSVIVNINKI